MQTPKGKDCVFVGGQVTDPEFFSEPTGIALRKGDAATKAKIDAGVKAVLTDGTFERLNAKYWPFSIKYDVPRD